MMTTRLFSAGSSTLGHGADFRLRCDCVFEGSPIVYCGQTLFESAEGIYEHSVTTAGSLTVPVGWLHASQGSLPIALHFTSSCSVGAAVTVQSGGVVGLGNEVLASDGSPVGALVYGVSPGMTVLTATSAGSTSTVNLTVEP